MEPIRLDVKIKKIRKLDDDFNIIFATSNTVEEKYITEFKTIVIQGHGHFAEKENITFVGNWMYNKKYDNWAFKFIDFERKKPEKKEEVATYLQSHIFSGIGPTLAQRIVDKFKDDTLQIISDTPERLKEIEGIGEKKYNKLMESYNQGEELKDLTKALVTPPVNLSAARIYKIYKILGKKALSKIEKNPYILCYRVPGINFKLADFIAREKFGVKIDAFIRVKAAIFFIINSQSSKGHLYITIGELMRELRYQIPDMQSDKLAQALEAMDNKEIKIIKNNSNNIHSAVFTKRLFDMEVFIGKKLIELGSKRKRLLSLAKYMKEVESELGITYADSQIKALEGISGTNVQVITGGPGTGKSTIINGIIKIYQKHNPMTKILLAAPTGRASKRMEETTGMEAKTIHRLLETSPTEGFKRNDTNPLDADVIIIDEASMIDVPLMFNLVRAIKTKTKLFIIGDADQLPSVGPGAVLRDMIDSDVIPVVKLNQVFRQGEKSLIKSNAQKINKGDTNLDFSDEEFKLIESNGSDAAKTDIVDTFVDELFKANQINSDIVKSLYSIQILAPTRVGRVGTIAINNAIQETINKNTLNEIVSRYKDEEGNDIETKFRIGDKVMQTENSAAKDVYNGDLGIITDIEKTDKDINATVEFEDGRMVEYSREEIKSSLILAYATTIHKSQGSEFPTVIMLTTSSQSFSNKRNTFYTGVTRARQKIIVCGDIEGIKQSILTIDSNKRNTMLKLFLKKFSS